MRVINDAYNANPSSNGGGGVVGQAGTRRVMIAGDMLELGRDMRRIHEEGAEIAALGGGPKQDAGETPRPHGGIDLLMAVGKLGRYIASGARSHGLLPGI